MSLDGHCPAGGSDPSAAIDVVTFPMPVGMVFDWHTHRSHQLAWAVSGVLTVRSETAAWVLPPTRALWIPADVPHQTLSEGTATMRALYIRPDACPIRWPTCTPVVASPLLAELIGYLEDVSLDPGRRANAETVLIDLLQPVSMTVIDVQMPTDAPARQVALALSSSPDDGRTLAEWGHLVGASERTLARSFIAETGIPFGRWRALLRLRTAMVLLAAEESVGTVARRVGYDSTSAFVAAFRKETGTTPTAYFRGDAVDDG